MNLNSSIIFMKTSVSISFLIALLITVSSCTKVEGPGGSSFIKGSVYAKKYDGAGNLLTEYFAPEEDVYIIYGDESSVFDDDVKTSYDGEFLFEYLELGSYQVFVYEKCSSCPSGKSVVLKTVEITEKKDTLDVGIIEIIK